MTESIRNQEDVRALIEGPRRKARRKSIAVNAVLYVVMAILAVILLVPYLYLVNRSLMTAENAKYSYDFFTRDWMFFAVCSGVASPRSMGAHSVCRISITLSSR